MGMFKITEILIKIIENFDELIFALFSRALPWGVAAGPAMILGHTATQWAVGAGIDPGSAGLVGGAIAVAIVVAGAVNAHLAIKYAEAWILVILTIGLEIIGLFLTGAETMPWVGTVAALIQGAVYVGRAWSAKDKKDEAKADDLQDREWELKKELRLKKQEDATKVRLAKVQASVKRPVNLDTSFDAQNMPNRSQNGQNTAQIPTKDAKLDQMVDIYLTAPKTGVTEIARQLSVSRQTVYNYQVELEQQGRIEKNGHGVVVK
jgi:hypothetical protein